MTLSFASLGRRSPSRRSIGCFAATAPATVPVVAPSLHIATGLPVA